MLVESGSGIYEEIAKDVNGENISVDANNDNEIQVSEAEAVRYMSIISFDINSLEGIDFFHNLMILNVVDTNLSALNVQGIDSLIQISISQCQLTSLDLSGMVNLEYFWILSNPLTALNFTGCTGLKQFYCGDVPLTSINFDGFTALESVYLGADTLLESVVFGYHPNLSYVDLISDTSLTSVDLSGCPALQVLGAVNSGLTFINIKNGAQVVGIEAIGSSDNPSGKYLCVDENEVQYYQELLADVPNLLISSYCDIDPGGAYNVISGLIYFNCTMETLVNGYIPVNINDGTGSGTAYTNTGNYNFFTQQGTFTLTPQVNNDWFTISPATATVAFTNNNNNLSTQNFCLTANGVHNDAEVIIMPLGSAQPGFDATYKIIYTNNGNQTLSGDVTFTYDDGVLDYVSASPVEAIVTTGSLTWSYINLEPFESREILLTLNVNSPMETPAVNIDDVLNVVATVTPVSGDEIPSDNTFAIKQVVVGSFDPNDITCLEGEVVNPDLIGEYLHYNINFENTGTAPASFIVVKDIIDETRFDLNCLQMINASHDVEVRRTGNKVEFYFNDINLAGNGGKGNVAFKIKTLNTLEVNDDVTQQAEIFFDYNWPIETNEATTVFAILNAGIFEKDTTIKVYPNPSGGIVNVSSDGDIGCVELFDIQGRLLQSTVVNGRETVLDISRRAAGVYFVKITTNKGAGVEKVIKTK